MTQHQKVSDDFVLPFQIEASGLRGRLVRLGPALNQILMRHAYSEKVGSVLGEAVAIAGALGTALKFDGIFTLQAKGEGSVRMLVVDVTSDGALRAYAQFDAARLEGEGATLGNGYLAFTVDQTLKDDRYQGIVKLEGERLGEAVQHYFRQSEQLPTGIVVAARKDNEGCWRGGCLLVQRMPCEGGYSPVNDTAIEDDWYRAMTLMQTCSPDELTDPTLASEDLLFRLFHEDGVRVYESQPLRHECRCSVERVGAVLNALPEDEVAKLAVKGVVTFTCEFCNRDYAFDEKRRAALKKSVRAEA
ncbi:MAG: molecular chaperone Hsp33 [Alphaproteobacteria bacterium]|nr:molecular chaperone Hsp33 [Alphaproteobacteria bacterium]